MKYLVPGNDIRIGDTVKIITNETDHFNGLIGNVVAEDLAENIYLKVLGDHHVWVNFRYLELVSPDQCGREAKFVPANAPRDGSTDTVGAVVGTVDERRSK